MTTSPTTNPLTALALCDRCGGWGRDPDGSGYTPGPLEDWRLAELPCNGCGGTGRKTVTLAPEGYAAAVYELGLRAEAHGMFLSPEDDERIERVRAHPEHGK